MRGAAHLPKGGLPGEEDASRPCDTVFANPLTGPRAAEDIAWEQDDSVLPMSGMGSRNFPAVRSMATQPPYTLSERVLGEVDQREVCTFVLSPEFLQQRPGSWRSAVSKPSVHQP
jgi:hypothetical protein